MGASAWVLRDLRKRVSAADVELQRRAYLYVARNTTLPAQVRHRAQLGLNSLNGGEGRMTSIRNRCTETSKGRGEYRTHFIKDEKMGDSGDKGDLGQMDRGRGLHVPSFVDWFLASSRRISGG